LAFQEFFIDNTKEKQTAAVTFLANKYTATIITLLMAYGLAKVGYLNIWPLFGSANQLLSALTLIACAVFLKKTNRENWMIWIPMCSMLCVTLTALSITIFNKTHAIFSLSTKNMSGDILQLSFALALMGLGISVAIQGIQKLMNTQKLTKSSSNEK
ncbi:MAG: carbon starvation CstA family protein, partial [Treponemataceae bacterium]